MGRDENVKEFNDTMAKCRDDPILEESIRQSISAQTIHLSSEPLSEKKVRFDATAVTVTKGRALQTARGLEGKVCVHNFASFTHPGGGVAKGSTAQEESICRISTLYPCLTDQRMMDGFYIPHKGFGSSLFNSDIIYTPGVKVFKLDSNNPITLPRESWYDVDVITCAAPNLRNGKVPDTRLFELQKERVSRILNVAMRHEANCLVLGAFGCGVFENDPSIVAQASKEALSYYEGCFRKVVFAIYSHSDDANFKAFSKIL